MPDAPRNGYLRPAARTAALGLGVGWTLSVLVMALSGHTDVRIAARIWLVAQGSGLTAGETRFGIVPVSATALFVLLMSWAARRSTRTEVSDLGRYAAAVATVIALVAAVVAAGTSTESVATSIPRAAVGGFAIGGLGSVLGAGWRYRSSWPVPAPVRLIARGAARAVATVLVAATVILLVLLAVHASRAGEVWGLLQPGWAGGLALALACVLSVPTLVLWVTSVLIGPGFAVGSGTWVDLTGSHLGLVPSFPTLAAVPDPGNFPGWVFLLGLVLPLAGVWAGTISPRARVGAAAGAVAGFVLGILVAMSGGGLGPGRMAEVGPPPVTPLLVAMAVLAASGALGSLLAHYRGRRVSRIPPASERGEIGGPGVGVWDESAGPDRRDARP